MEISRAIASMWFQWSSNQIHHWSSDIVVVIISVGSIMINGDERDGNGVRILFSLRVNRFGLV